MTAGEVLLDAAARAGFYGLMTRSTGPQIRGGEAAAMVRLGQSPIDCQDDRLDLLIALDFNQAERFAPELMLDGDSLVLADFESAEPPAWIADSAASRSAVGFQDLLKAHRGVRINTMAIGLAGRWLGLPEACIHAALQARFEPMGETIVERALTGAELGRKAAGDLPESATIPPPDQADSRWMMTGNQAAALGALQGGIRFCAAYPITPSTEILEWLAGHLPELGGQLVQAEDELASINLCIGASYGGVPALTATSGPGLSLMVEALGLATMAEIPLVVINVMRGGPSTGIPTRPEQSDLNLAVYGAHGDAPRLVLAPNSVADCRATTAWAVELAESLQCPAIVLSDQFLAQSRTIIRQPESLLPALRSRRLAEAGHPNGRYQPDNGPVTAMPLPGTPGQAYTATGLAHDQSGRPSTLASDHHAHLDRRRAKLEQLDPGPRWADIEDGDGDAASDDQRPGRPVVLTWGSASAACRDACARWRDRGQAVRLISLRLLSPLRIDQLQIAMEGCQQLLVVEHTHSGQFLGYLKSRLELPAITQSLRQPGPLTLRPGQVLAALETLTRREEAA